MDYIGFIKINAASVGEPITILGGQDVAPEALYCRIKRKNGAVLYLLVPFMIRSVLNGICRVVNAELLARWNFNGHKTITLYHGSPFSTLRPKFGVGDDEHDYGRGLYFTPEKNLAREWAVQHNSDGYLFKIVLSFDAIKLLNFNYYSPLVWVAELLKHRGGTEHGYAGVVMKGIVDTYGINTKGYDILAGFRADASYFKIAKSFTGTLLDASLLTEALVLGNLGMQYCFKSKKAFDILRPEYKAMEFVSARKYYSSYIERDKRARSDLDKLLRSSRNNLAYTALDIVRDYNGRDRLICG